MGPLQFVEGLPLLASSYTIFYILKHPIGTVVSILLGKIIIWIEFRSNFFFTLQWCFERWRDRKKLNVDKSCCVWPWSSIIRISFIISRVLRDSIGHYIGRSVVRSVIHSLFRLFWFLNILNKDRFMKFLIAK